MEQQWLGIQFNWIEKFDLRPLFKKYEKYGMKTDGEHITIEFSNDELSQIKNNNYDSEKLQAAMSIIKEYLHLSDYTNIYTYINADKFVKEKSNLLENDFQKPLRKTKPFSNTKIFIANFENQVHSQNIKNHIWNAPLTIFMNKLFELVAERDFALEQTLTLDLRYEDKDEWLADHDVFNVSIQLDKDNG